MLFGKTFVVVIGACIRETLGRGKFKNVNFLKGKSFKTKFHSTYQFEDLCVARCIHASESPR